MNNLDILLESIIKYDGDDIVIPYWQIAHLFPTDNPHPDSMDYKSIDQDALKTWASENGFIVSMLPDQAPENAKNSPPIRFKSRVIDA